MNKEKLMDLTGNAVLLILTGVISFGLLCIYATADQQTKDEIFWFMVTQPQE